MINAYAAKEPGGKLERFEYDPGELASHDVEIDVESSPRLSLHRERLIRRDHIQTFPVFHLALLLHMH